MKFTSSSTVRRSTASAALRFFGGPQMPAPVRRIEPNPIRLTEISPPKETVPAKVADTLLLFILPSWTPLTIYMDAAASQSESALDERPGSVPTSLVNFRAFPDNQVSP